MCNTGRLGSGHHSQRARESVNVLITRPDVVWLDATGTNVFRLQLQLAPELQQSLTRPEAGTAAERGVRA
jgi:hypothetical protein